MKYDGVIKQILIFFNKKKRLTFTRVVFIDFLPNQSSQHNLWAGWAQGPDQIT